MFNNQLEIIMIRNKINLWSFILFISMISMSYAANVSLKIQNVVLGDSSCSDGTSATIELCEAAGTCSDNTSATVEACEAAAGTCTDDTSVTQALCEAAGICSDSTYDNVTDCEAAVETCSDPTYTDETICENNGVCTGACVDSSCTSPDITQPTDQEACLDPADDDDGGSDTAGTWVAHEWTSISWSPESWNPEYEWTPEKWTSEGTLDIYMKNHANCTWSEGANVIVNYEIEEAECIGTCDGNIGVCTDGTIGYCANNTITDQTTCEATACGDANCVWTTAEEACCEGVCTGACADPLGPCPDASQPTDKEECLDPADDGSGTAGTWSGGEGEWSAAALNCDDPTGGSDVVWEMATEENCCESTGGQWCNSTCTGGNGVYDGGKQGDMFDGNVHGFQFELIGISVPDGTSAITNGTSSELFYVKSSKNAATQNSQIVGLDFGDGKIPPGEGILLSVAFTDYAGQVMTDGVEVLNGDICFGSLPQYNLTSGPTNAQNEAESLYSGWECNCFDSSDIDDCGICQGTNTCDGTMTAGVCSSTTFSGGLFDCMGECGGSVLADCDGVCGGSEPDADSDGVCDDVDTCTGANANDTDSDGLCDDIDPCPNDATGDSDCDESCDSADLCIGDDNTGDSDSDGVCDDSDNCSGTDIGEDVDENGCTLTIVHSSSHTPTEYTISQNYPNPFNPVTNITFNVPKMDEISLVIYDIAGKEVITLASGTFMPGSYLVSWDAVNNVGDAIASGMYVYSYISSEKTITRKMLYLK